MTPCVVGDSESQVNDLARQAGANPITLPSSNPSTAPTTTGGEISPTGVQELNIYPSWTDAKDPPSWYTKGADVDALLDVADTLDWLADTGDLNETYQPPDGDLELDGAIATADTKTPTVNNSTSVTTLPHVDSNVESVVPPLPSLFGGTTSTADEENSPKATLSSSLGDDNTNNKEVEGVGDDKGAVLGATSHTSESDMQHLEVFDSPMEEHDFVATILETKSTDNLGTL